MGNKLTRDEEESLSESLQDEYLFQSNQNLLHKATQRPCTLHKITTFSNEEATAVSRNLQAYRNCKCHSVSHLREHFTLDNTSYCSDQEKFYLIFDGGHSPNVKEEFFSRRYNQASFQPHQIESILSCMLCGLREYYGIFARKQLRVGLESVCIDRQKRGKLSLRDPWLAEKNGDSSKAPVNFFATYPSPEKIHSSSQAILDYDEFKSDLFTIGVLGLQLSYMNFQDDLYLQKKFVDRQKITHLLSQIREGRLRGGLAILLNQNPDNRLQIYQYWDILCSKEYFLDDVQQIHPPPIRKYDLNVSQASNPYPRPPIQQNPHINFNNSMVRAPVNPTINLNRTPLHQQFSKPLQIKKAINQATEVKVQRPQSQTQPQLQLQAQTQSRPQSRPAVTFNPQNQAPLNIPSQPPNIRLQSSIPPPQMPPPYMNSPPLQQTPKFNLYQSSGLQSSAGFHPNTGSFQIPGPSSFKIMDQLSSANSGMGTSGSRVFFNSTTVPLSKSIVSSTEAIGNGTSNNSIVAPKSGYSPQKTVSFDQMQSPMQSFTLGHLENKQSFELPASQSYQLNRPQEEIREEETGATGKQSIISSLLEDEEQRRNSPETRDEEIRPTSPSTFEATPQQQGRSGRNKYNSTIVQVNEETPNESQQSDNEGDPREIQYVVEEYETGSRYEGFKKNGVRNGRGKFYYQDGGYYDGQWKNNQMHGWGKLFYEGGKLAYEGNWAHDQFHGFGKVHNDNPLMLDCGFDYTNFDLLDDYWEFYEGMLANDTKEDRGRIKLTNNETFEGDFHKDRIQGFGKFLKKDGSVVQGIWRDSRLIKILNTADIYK